MNKGEIVTVEDLRIFGEKFKNDISGIIQSKFQPSQKFYSPKEFSAKTSMPYSTVVYKCKMGKLKAFQDSPNCSWLIDASELERYITLAESNVTGAITN